MQSGQPFLINDREICPEKVGQMGTLEGRKGGIERLVWKYG